MGDRISIQFSDGSSESVYLFSHWDGEGLKEDVETYLDKLYDDLKKDKNLISYPLGRFEPGTVMMDFIRWKFQDQKERIDSNYYIEKEENHGDNSDNGNFVYTLTEKGWTDGTRKIHRRHKI